jgi:hypothetical protein
VLGKARGHTEFSASITASTSQPLRGSESSGGTSLALEAAPVLPQRWEVRKTDEGQTYWVDHKARTTSWVRPDMIDNMDSIPAGWEARSVRDG